MTQEAFSQLDITTERYPLSFTQRYFHSLDEGDLNGAFGNRFTIVSGLRIAGHVDVATLQGALDDVIERHELLRTVVVRDAEPPYQQVYPPCRVPLEIRDYPATRDRDAAAEELLIEGEKATMSARQVPLLQAAFTRFDDTDSVLVLVVHHSASDAWSQRLIMRDLGAFYNARANHRPVELPPVKQYREYAEWQEAGAAETSEARQYWRAKLSGTQVLALPNDRPRPEVYSRPFSGYRYVVSADDMAAVHKFSSQARSSTFMVLMAAFSVFSYQLTSRPAPAIRAFTTGRDEPTFQNTMGLFLNVVPFQTDIGGCESYREIVASTRETCIDAYTHEVPISVIEQDLPDFNAPHEDHSNSQFILGMYQGLYGEDEALPIADGAREFFKQALNTETSDIPSGIVWNMAVADSGALVGDVTYNLDEFDEGKVAGWVSGFNRILSQLVSEPDREWRQLTGLTS
jgi:condensation enzyme